MSIPSDFLQSWEYLPPRDVVSVYEAEPSRHSALWSIQNEVRPADLFCYFGARFGPPNGIQNFYRKDDSDNLIHWDWTFRTSLGSIVVLGLNFRTDIMVGSNIELDASDRDELIRQIKADFSEHGKGMSVIRKALEPWIEFVNPYHRLRHAITELRNQLEALQLRPVEEAIEDPQIGKPSNDDEDTWNAMTQRYSQGVGLCFGIRSMLPVMAEAFINMLLYVLMRPDIRSDTRLSGHLFRQPIDIRVKSLNFNCIGFTQRIDYSHPACGRYHSLVNERNDLLHGNVVIDKLKFNEVYFWDKVPVFKEYRSMWQRSVGVSIEAAGLQRVLDEADTVDEFIEYVLGCLDPDLLPKVRALLDRRDLGFNTETGRVGVLFPDWLVDMVPVMREEERTTTTERDDQDSVV